MNKSIYSLLSAVLLASVAALKKGDVAIIGVAANQGSAEPKESVALLTLVDLAEGQELFVTDDNWVAATGTFAVQEGVVRYTVPAGGLPAGSVIVNDVVNPGATTGPHPQGWSQVGARNPPLLGNSGDSVVVYTVDNNVIQILWQIVTENDKTTYGYPDTEDVKLILGGSADNGVYNGPTSGTKEYLVSKLRNSNNYNKNSGAPLDMSTLTNFEIKASSSESLNGGDYTMFVEEDPDTQGNYLLTVTATRTCSGGPCNWYAVGMDGSNMIGKAFFVDISTPTAPVSKEVCLAGYFQPSDCSTSSNPTVLSVITTSTTQTIVLSTSGFGGKTFAGAQDFFVASGESSNGFLSQHSTTPEIKRIELRPQTQAPTNSPTTSRPTNSPTLPTSAPTNSPTTSRPTNSPTAPTAKPTTGRPTTQSPTTAVPTSSPTTTTPAGLSSTEKGIFAGVVGLFSVLAIAGLVSFKLKSRAAQSGTIGVYSTSAKTDVEM